MENTEKFLFVRGSRFLPLLVEDKTYAELGRQIEVGFPNTTKRQYATQPVQIIELKIIPYVGMKTLYINGKARSKGKLYQPQLLFKDVQYEPEDSPTNVTFMGSDGNEYHMKPISLSRNNVRTRCDCLDFYFRMSVWNHRDNALYGRKPRPYQRKTLHYPPVNPMEVSGICKHIIKMVDALVQSGMLVP